MNDLGSISFKGEVTLFDIDITLVYSEKDKNTALENIKEGIITMAGYLDA